MDAAGNSRKKTSRARCPVARADPIMDTPFAITSGPTFHAAMTKPEKPTMLWDGDCGFCGRWIRRWKKLTGSAVDYRRYQDALEDFPQVREEDCRRAVQLVLPDGRVLSAAHAVLRALDAGGRFPFLHSTYQKSRIFRACAETAYRFVAANRSWLPG